MLKGPAEIVDLARARPELRVHPGDLPATAEALRDVFAASGKFFERGVPVRVISPADGGGPLAVPLTNHSVTIEAHRLCQPMKLDARGELKPVTLPDRVARMYLDMADWHLLPLVGVSTSPLLEADGTIRIADGYDVSTGLWCRGVPRVSVPSRPSQIDAAAALSRLRTEFRTFPFADATLTWDSELGVRVVDQAVPPARDESGFLVALLTAVSRPSLQLAPGLLMTAPSLSGAGSGKGLLVRAICAIAFGIRPRAFTFGGDRHELDKRIAAELIEAQPTLFLDNVNGIALRSDILASVLTERPAIVRLLGVTRMVPLNSSAFIAITGNGVSITEDLARRFMTCALNARCEDPESRPFPIGFLDQIERRRIELLTSALTIWRWGRQQTPQLSRGKPLGSFETWAEWCRDPFLSLGCQDPVERIEALKANDPRRERITELFTTWWQHHGAAAVKVNQLDQSVKDAADPQGRGRQYLATFIASLSGTYAAGFVLNRQEAAGKWSAATYALKKTDEGPHRANRPDRGADRDTLAPDAHNGPMGPMPDDDADFVPAGGETEL
jgi:hypothetical protein